MSSEDDLYAGDSDQANDSQSELARLNALHDDLVEAVQTAINPTVRADLAAELRSVRERIAELSMSGDAGARRAPEPGATVHSYEVPPTQVEGNGAEGPTFEARSAPGYGDGAYHQPTGSPGGLSGLDRAPAYGYQGQAPGPGYAPAGPAGDAGWNRGPGGFAAPRSQTAFNVQPESRRSFWSSRPWLPLILAILGGLVLAGVIGFGGLFGDEEDGVASSTGEESSETDPAAPGMGQAVTSIRTMLDSMGFSSVAVEDRGGSVALVGSVTSDADRQAVIGAASALAGALPFDSSALVVTGAGGGTPTSLDPGSRAASMQRELERTLALTPITFDEGQVAITERHQLVLNNVVTTMEAYPDQSVNVIGYTDGDGSIEANEQLSRSRAQNVRDYLVNQGVSGDRLNVVAKGETEATGSDEVGVLERRVEFEVVGGVATVGDGSLRIGVVTPSASNDLAFSQSMVDAVNLLAQQRGLHVEVADGLFVQSDAEAKMREYANQGFDLVIAHGSQYAAEVQKVAGEFPGVAFAWGTASDTFGLSNVYAYDAQAQQGGYVLGAMAAQLSTSTTLGVVGPFEVGDAKLYIDGFRAGAEAERAGTTVRVDYIETFNDTAAANLSATEHLGAGADVLTGTSQMVAGAVEVAVGQNVPWFGTQANQSSLATDLVVASQVYHWEVVLGPILDDVAAGNLRGSVNSITLANNGLVIEYNDGFALPPEVRQRGDQLVEDIKSGAVVPPG